MIVTLTEAALSKLKEMVVEEEHSPRIDANVAGGCGVSVAFKLVFDEPRRGDTIIEYENIKIVNRSFYKTLFRRSYANRLYRRKWIYSW